MNKTLAITAIALVAVVMVVGTIAPVMADGPPEKCNPRSGDTGCAAYKCPKAHPDTIPCEPRDPPNPPRARP